MDLQDLDPNERITLLHLAKEDVNPFAVCTGRTLDALVEKRLVMVSGGREDPQAAVVCTPEGYALAREIELAVDP